MGLHRSKSFRPYPLISSDKIMTPYRSFLDHVGHNVIAGPTSTKVRMRNGDGHPLTGVGASRLLYLTVDFVYHTQRRFMLYL